MHEIQRSKFLKRNWNVSEGAREAFLRVIYQFAFFSCHVTKTPVSNKGQFSNLFGLVSRLKQVFTLCTIKFLSFCVHHDVSLFIVHVVINLFVFFQRVSSEFFITLPKRKEIMKHEYFSDLRSILYNDTSTTSSVTHHLYKKL